MPKYIVRLESAVEFEADSSHEAYVKWMESSAEKKVEYIERAEVWLKDEYLSETGDFNPIEEHDLG